MAPPFGVRRMCAAMRRPLAWSFFLAVPVILGPAACGSNGGADGPGGPGGGPGSGSDASTSYDAAPGVDASSSAPVDAALDAAHDGPVSTMTPIKHVVVVVKENHTFDNYFGTFPGAEGSTTCQTTSGAIPAPHAPNSTPRDLCHQHSCALGDWDGGKMDGWLSVSGASQNGDNLFCAQYQESDIPNYWAYARKYALADHFFADVLGPSFPGHAFVLAAQAGWATDNPGLSLLNPYWGCDEAAQYTVPVLDHGTCTTQNVAPCFDIPSVPTLLPAGTDWRFYGSDYYLLPEIWSMFDAIKPVRQTSLWNNVVNVTQFDGDVQSGKLPAVTWLVDQDFSDEHPTIGGVCQGENWTVGHLNNLMQSPLWKDTVIFFTMDDFGGWYDHVPPPRQYGCDPATPYGLGFRLPLVVMSPYVKPGVYKNVAEQASIVKFILENFHATQFLADLDPAAQDKQANDLMDMFDWNQAPVEPLMLTQRSNCPP